MKKGVEQNAILSGKPMMIGGTKHRASALALFPLAALIALASGLASPTGASVRTLCTLPNRAGENSVAAVLLRLAQSPQTANPQWENSIGRYDVTLDDALAAESAANPVLGLTRVGSALKEDWGFQRPSRSMNCSTESPASAMMRRSVPVRTCL